jgi:hypothetical protein
MSHIFGGGGAPPPPPPPVPTPPMPDLQSPAVMEAQQLQTASILERSGRRSTILSQGGSSAPYSRPVLGG